MKTTRDMLELNELQEKGLYAYLFEFATLCKNEGCLADERNVYTAGKVFACTRSLAAQLIRAGVKTGDIVALRMTRDPETLLVFYALQTMGAVAVLCDEHFGVKQYLAEMGNVIDAKYMLSNEGGRYALYDEKFEILCEPSLWEEVPYDGVALDKIITNVDIHGPSFVLFTSGTTGKSKAVVQSQYALFNTLVDTGESRAAKEGDKELVILPLYHLFSLCLVGAALVAREMMIFPDKMGIEDTFRNIEKYKINRLFAVPTYFIMMAQSNLTEKYDINSLRVGYTAAGPYTEEQYRNIEEKLGCIMAGGYGMSEFIGISLTHIPASIDVRAKGVGFVYKQIECKILDGENNELPLLEEGEICVKGYPMMLGYYNDPEATAQIIDENGFLHTGDLGFLDEDGIIYVTGRKKELIIRGGLNISPYKIEVALTKLPYIQAACSCGIQDKVYGEIPAAAIVVNTDMGVSLEDIKRDLLARELLIKPALPEKIVVLEALPLLPTGKVDKLKVKEILGKA